MPSSTYNLKRNKLKRKQFWERKTAEECGPWGGQQSQLGGSTHEYGERLESVFLKTK